MDTAEPFNVPVDPIKLGIPVSLISYLFFLCTGRMVEKHASMLL